MQAKVILFKSKTLSTGEHPLMLRLTDKDKRKYIALGVSLLAKSWNFKKDCYKSTPIPEGTSEEQKKTIEKSDAEIRELITYYENKYTNKIKELAIAQKNISLDTLMEIVDKPLQRSVSVLGYFKEVNQTFKDQGKVGNYKVYYQTYNALSDFLNDTRGKGKWEQKKGKKKDHSQDFDITFQEIDVRLLKEFERYLLKDHPDQRKRAGTVSIYMRTLRALYNLAISEGIAATDDYSFSQRKGDHNYEMPKGNNAKRALSSDEISRLLSLKVNSDYYRYMIFTYYAFGVNFIDLAHLKWTNIHDNILSYQRKKLEHIGDNVGMVEVPLDDHALGVLKYYKPLTGIDRLNYIFPILDRHEHITPDQQDNRIRKMLKLFNKELVKYGQQAGTKNKVTSYVLRHSVFSELIRKGLHLNIVKALAGHENIQTTMLYVEKAGMEDKLKAVKML